MTDSKDDFRDMERQLALEAARKAVANGKHKAFDPADMAESAVRGGVAAVAGAAIRGGRAVLGGLADAGGSEFPKDDEKPAKDKAEDDAGDDNDASDPHAPTHGPTIEGETAEQANKSWFDKKKDQVDDVVSDLANTPEPLSKKILWGAARSIVANGARYIDWATNTYPHVLRPLRYVAQKMRDRLDAKVKAGETAPTDWQKLKRRLYSIGPSGNLLSKLRYGAINTVTAVMIASTAMSGLAGAAISYGTYNTYNDVTITNIFRNPDNKNYAAEVHGYQIDSKGNRDSTFFDISWNPFYLNFFPQYTVSNMSIGDVCTIHTWGTTTRLPLSFRKMVDWNPVIISADCHKPGAATEVAPVTPLQPSFQQQTFNSGEPLKVSWGDETQAYRPAASAYVQKPPAMAGLAYG